jgi:hypothetical protein
MTSKHLAALLAATALAAPTLAAEEKPAPSGASPPAAAGSPPAGKGPASADAPATKEEVRTLAEELRRLKLEVGIPDVEYRSFAGMGPAASKIYYQPKGLALGGYGEFTYRNNLDDLPNDQSDLLRAVLYAGYRFTPGIVFNSEIEFEHAGHEVGVEFAYLDFLFTDALRLRVGNVLIPIGFVNEMHEPPFFHGVLRPEVERVIIPTTWHENGIGLYGELRGLRYKAYLVNGLDPVGTAGGDEPVRASDWLRRGRTGGGESIAESFAGVLNLSYEYGPAVVGGTVYHGRAGQGRSAPSGARITAEVTMLEAHAGVAWRGLQARGLVVHGRLSQANLVSEALGLTGNAVIGSQVLGAYGELAYDVLARGGHEASLSPFVRYEYVDLHREVPAGGTRNPALRYDLVTTGLTFKPIPTVVLKADFQWKHTDAAAGAVTRAVNVGAGFVF